MIEIESEILWQLQVRLQDVQIDIVKMDCGNPFCQTDLLIARLHEIFDSDPSWNFGQFCMSQYMKCCEICISEGIPFGFKRNSDKAWFVDLQFLADPSFQEVAQTLLNT